MAAYGIGLPMSGSSAIVFGGDATGDPSEAVHTLNDSSWVLSFPSSAAVLPTAIHEIAGWANQPQRRQLVYGTSATNGIISRAWIFGGLQSDGSGIPNAELWELAVVLDPIGGISVGVGGGWARWMGTGGPPAMYDGVAVLVPRATGEPSLYLIGGTQVMGGLTTLTDMSSIWSYTPSTSLAGGSWSQVRTTNAPIARRGHVAVVTPGGSIWLQGGRSLDGTVVYSDSAMLDLGSSTWTAASAGQQVWGHSAVVVGQTVVLALGTYLLSWLRTRTDRIAGYGMNAPVSSALSVYAPGNDTWLTSYHPSFLVAVPATPSSTPVDSLSNPKTDVPSPSTVPFHAPGIPTISLQPSPTSSPNPTATSASDYNNLAAIAAAAQKRTIGIVVGVLITLLLLALAIFFYRRRSRVKGTTPILRGGRGWHAYGADADSLGEREYAIEKAVPFGTREEGGGGRGMWGKMWRGKGEEGRTRFDMLKDEESEKFDSVGSRKGWDTFEGEDEEGGEGEGEVLSGRAGLGVWDGFGGSSSLQPSNSFLGTALGGFAGISKREGGLGRSRTTDTVLDSIGEEHQDDGTYDSTESRSTTTHRSNSTAPTTASHRPVARNVSAGSSLYGLSNFPPSVGHIPTLAPRSSLSHSEDPEHLRRTSTWWSRLGGAGGSVGGSGSKPSTMDMSTSTSTERIRDPTPAPSMDAIAHRDPFLDVIYGRADEQGRFDAKTMGLKHGKSLSSVRSTGTATSSVLEERMKGMDVVQRIRDGSASTISRASSMGHGDDGGSQVSSVYQYVPPSTSDDPFEDPPTTPTQDSNRRLVGPRPLESPLHPLIPTKAALAPSTPPTGVRALISQIETDLARSSSPLSASLLSPSASIATSHGSSPKKPKGVRVGHGLAKKPVLYVANPDGRD